ncbi:MAG: esterase family protein [Clostridia bacterium]|nr:esterase family protein [Clostridia bacterium]MBR1684478.1 esterase family protein [Clostridia bacterium]MBR2286688.1 esterase family protein [Clostridia bacterium]
MQTQYWNEYSPALGRNMDLKRYGHGGRPVLFIPCQDGRFFDFENFHMTDIWGPYIERGECSVYSIDVIDQETWSNAGGDPAWRIGRHEDWMRFITDEVVPFIRDDINRLNGWSGYPGIIAFGCSLGALHAANLFFRRPDLFDGLLALSGIYTASYGFGSFSNEQVYLNSPVDYLANMPDDHPYIERYRNSRGIICVGTGPWEMPETTLRIREIAEQKHMGIWVDVWGSDAGHDWDWWYKQVSYHIPHLLY